MSQAHKSIVPIAGIEDGAMYAVVSFPKLLEHINYIMKVQERMAFHLDSTYNVFHYYTTILSIKHPFFQRHPVVPITIMFHECKGTTAHAKMMKIVVENMPYANSNLAVFITDREAAIRNAIENAAP